MAGAVGLSADAAAASSKPEGKGLLARMPPHLADACIAKMCVFNFVPGDVIIEHNTIGTSMVRILAVPPPRLCNATSPLAQSLNARVWCARVGVCCCDRA